MSRLDPEMIGPLQGLLEATGGGFSLRDIPATRKMTAEMVAAVKAEIGPIPGVTTEDLRVSSAESSVEVPVRIYRPDGLDGPLPALIWMHPGGYVIGSIEMDDLMAAQLCKDAACAVVSIDYRLAPENPYPAALDDCYSVLQWVGEHAGDIAVDASRIAVGGSSAGGGLAAALALRARDQGGVQPCFQLLIYPALDDRNTEQVSDRVEENLFWSRENALTGWSAYLEGRQGSDDVPTYAAAFRAEDLSRLPPAFIAVGSADMFLGESIAYAERLSAAGVTTALQVYPGAFHAFDAFAPMARTSQKFVADRNAALRAAFA